MSDQSSTKKSEPFLWAGQNRVCSDEERQQMIENAAVHYGNFMTALGLDWLIDPNSKDTPRRVAKAFVNELWSGMYSKAPKVTDFENVNKYQGMVFQGNIDVKSMCSHHHLLFTGKAHVAYIPSDKPDESRIIGLSKLNRIVEFFSRRPQVQENLTMQIAEYIDKLIPNNRGVAIVIEADHTCASCRGVQHDSRMHTSHLTGYFFHDAKTRSEFYHFVQNLHKR